MLLLWIGLLIGQVARHYSSQLQTKRTVVGKQGEQISLPDTQLLTRDHGRAAHAPVSREYRNCHDPPIVARCVGRPPLNIFNYVKYSLTHGLPLMLRRQGRLP